jgi:Beta-ketoacyl synthase, N-terminal domain
MIARSRNPRLTVHVDGVGLWAPRLPGWETARGILRGDTDAPREPAPRPAPELLAPNERRRAPDSVAVALHVAQRACSAARCEPRSLASVFASTYGDSAVSDAVCAQLVGAPLDTSPTKFHHSVHNAAAGYWAIGTGCLEPYTAVSAHRHTFGAGLLTAAVQAVTEGSRVLYVAYDIESCGPLATMAHSRGMLGVALVLGARTSAETISRLVLRAEEREASPTPARPQNTALVAGNAMAPSLALFEGLADRAARSIVLTLGRQLALAVALEP